MTRVAARPARYLMAATLERDSDCSITGGHRSGGVRCSVSSAERSAHGNGYIVSITYNDFGEDAISVTYGVSKS